MSWRRGGRAPTVRRRRTRRKGDDREAYRRAEADRDLEAERASALERAEIARARADAEEARLRLARREADAGREAAGAGATEARNGAGVRLHRRRRAATLQLGPRLSPLVTRPEPSPEKPADDDSFPDFRKPLSRLPGNQRPGRQRPGTPREPTPRVDAPSEQSLPHVEPTPEPTPRQWPPFGQELIGAHVKIHVEGVWLRGEITDVAAAMPELEGGNGVCIHVNNAGEDEWHEYGSDEVRIRRNGRRNIAFIPRPPFGDELVGHYVQVHVAGAWLDAVIVEAEVHDGT